MRQFTFRVTVVALLVLAGLPTAIAQSPPPDFELTVFTTDTTVSVQCVRGCKLAVPTVQPDGETQWKVQRDFKFGACSSPECSSAHVLGGVVTESPSPDFELSVANRGEYIAIKCVRGCKFAWVAGAPDPEAPPPMRVQEIQFPCSPHACYSGRIRGWIEP